MNILFLTYSFAPRVGGIESHSLILANGLAAAGYEVCLLTMTASREPDNYPFQVVRQPDFSDTMQWYRWSDLVFENNPVLKLSLFNSWFRRPRLTVIHTWLYPPGGTINRTARFKQWWLGKADRIVVVSKALQKHIPHRTLVIPNPYKDDLFQSLAERQASGTFVFLGRLVSDKGLHIALEAIRQLKESSLLTPDEKQSIRFTVIGDGPQKQELIEYAQTLGITDQVDFTGVLKGKALVRMLNKHRFAIIPSIWEEPFGMVALEAMACGCIPVASDSGGLPEAIGEAGLLFEKGNSRDLTDQLIRLLQQPSLQQELREKARGHLRKHTAEKIVKAYIACVEACSKTTLAAGTSPN